MSDSNHCAIIVHGGAGKIPEELHAECEAGVRAALLAGWRVLAAGGSALDAAQAAVVELEDAPVFNAGTGAVLNAAGEIELDASLMDGATRTAGAVAAMHGVRNPILAARAVLDDGRHVLLAGEGALRFALDAGVPALPWQDLVVPRQQRRWQNTHGTVGCVARDRAGGLAAATSTGGIFDKRPGRVGDSALIGCGTYADDLAGVSCTGDGEAVIRTVLAKFAADAVRAGCSPQTAAEQAVAQLGRITGGRVGVIVVDRQARVGHARNTDHMPVAYRSGDRRPVVLV